MCIRGDARAGLRHTDATGIALSETAWFQQRARAWQVAKRAMLAWMPVGCLTRAYKGTEHARMPSDDVAHRGRELVALRMDADAVVTYDGSAGLQVIAEQS